MSEFETFDQVIHANNFVILDTETTGLRNAEICSIGILSADGQTLLDTLVKPTRPIPPDATRIHGISDEDVVNAPSWAQVRKQVLQHIMGKDLVIYNASYDIGIMYSSDHHAGIGTKERIYNVAPSSIWCAMLWYADIHGEWDDYHGNNRWQRLTNAIQQQGLTVADAHHALGDCQMTLALIRKLIR